MNLRNATHAAAAVLLGTMLTPIFGTDISAQAVAPKPAVSQSVAAVSGEVLLADGTRKPFSDLLGFEVEKTGLMSGQERFIPRPGKLFFEARRPTRIVVVELGKMARIALAKPTEQYGPMTVTVTWRDGKVETFLALSTRLEVVWVNSKLAEQYSVYGEGDDLFAGATISIGR